MTTPGSDYFTFVADHIEQRFAMASDAHVAVRETLSHPDFQALKKWLKHESISDQDNFGSPPGRQMLDWNLSPEFVEWVLS
jgi:hypothetical protein